MNHLTNLKKLEAAEVREYLKQNLGDESLIEEIVDQKDQFVPFLLAHKFLPDVVIKKLSKDGANLTFLLEQFIQSNYTPSMAFIESLIDLGDSGDENVLKALKAFPTLPITIQIEMRLINDGLIKSAIFLAKTKPEFKKSEVLMLLVKTGAEDQEFVQSCLENESVLTQIVEEINASNFHLSINLINQVITSGNYPDLNVINLLTNYQYLSPAAYQHILEQGLPRKESTNHYGGRTSTVEKHELQWSEVFEKLDEDLFSQVILKGAPANSKFRLNFISRYPGDGEDEELISLVKSRKANVGVLYEILSRSLELVKQVDPELFERNFTPTKLAESIRHKETKEKVLYFLNELSSKFSPALRKNLSVEEVPQENNARKKSYFAEIFQALKNNDISEMRSAASHGYTLAQFAEDSHQSSKKRSCEITSLNSEFVSQLSKSELLNICNTPFRVSHYDDHKMPFKLSVDEALVVLGKFNVTDCFDHCEDQVQFLGSSELSADNVESLFSNRRDLIMSNPELLKTYLSKAKNNKDMSFDSDAVKALSKILTTADMRKFINPDEYVLRAILSVKGTDGEYFVTKEQIFDLLKERNNLESDEFLASLIARDRELAKEVVKAYLGGNKELSDLTGHKITLRRMAKSKFETLEKELEQDTGAIVDQVFARGGKWNDFKKEIFDPEAALNQYHNGRVVDLGEIDMSDLSGFKSIPEVSLKVDALTIGSRHWIPESLSDYDIPKTLSFDKVILNSRSSSEDKFVSLIKEVQSAYPKAQIVVGDGFSFSTKLSLIMSGVEFTGSDEMVQQALADRAIEIGTLDLEQIVYLEGKGLLVDLELIKQIIEEHNQSPEIISWLVSRVGDLKDQIMSSDDFEYADEEVQKIFKKAGVLVVPTEELELLKIENSLEAEGANFNPVDVSSLDLKGKAHLIKFIENHVDKNYGQLNLLSSNLESLETLSPYEAMRAMHSLDDKDMVVLFSIPNNVAQNKKLMKGIRDLLTIRGSGLAQKVQALKDTMQMINSTVELTLADFLDYSNQAEVVESETFQSIKSFALTSLGSLSSQIKGQGIILKNKNKSEILRFLRSASSREDNYLRDTLQMIESVLRGVDALVERVKALPEDQDNEATIIELNNSIQSVTARLAEVSAMDDIEHMHDRLVPLLSFIKSDPNQALGQDKFIKLEKSNDMEGRLGYRLFFPKTRGDLQFLGDTNGWCVNHSKSYGDNIIAKGNILVGICEKGKEAIKENVIALAHYTNNNGRYSLEQLKWSNRVKKSNNVDATKDFNHSSILSEITQYLIQYNKEKGKK